MDWRSELTHSPYEPLSQRDSECSSTLQSGRQWYGVPVTWGKDLKNEPEWTASIQVIGKAGQRGCPKDQGMKGGKGKGWGAGLASAGAGRIEFVLSF